MVKHDHSDVTPAGVVCQIRSVASTTLKYVYSTLTQKTTDHSDTRSHSSCNEEDPNVPCLDQLSIYSLDDVLQHNKADDCWFVIYDRVYDVTNLIQEHPGGEEVMLEYAGFDATLAFRGVGHSASALQQLEDYLVGILPQCERLYERVNQ